jgi:hypothetical protein
VPDTSQLYCLVTVSTANAGKDASDLLAALAAGRPTDEP